MSNGSMTWESEAHRQAVLAETVAAAIENRIPFQENKPVGRAEAEGDSAASAPLERVQDRPARQPPLESSVFTEADLFSLAHRTQRVEMPGRKFVYVHTLSLEEVGWVNAQALEYVNRKGSLSDEERRTWYALAVKLYQTIACARTGPEPGAPAVFSAKNHEALARNLGWAKLEQIGTLSDKLGLENGEQELVTDFFGRVARCCSTISARWTTDSANVCRAAMQELASLASSVAQRGHLVPGDLDALAVVMSGVEA